MSAAAPIPAENPCPCRSGEVFARCCGRYLSGLSDSVAPLYAPTAEALMRSRFTAFAVRDAHYLQRTWHPSTRPATLDLEPDQDWFLLEIVATAGGGPFEETGVVQFRAHFRSRTDRRLRNTLGETSSFERVDGQWFYKDALDFESD